MNEREVEAWEQCRDQARLVCVPSAWTLTNPVWIEEHYQWYINMENDYHGV